MTEQPNTEPHTDPAAGVTGETESGSSEPVADTGFTETGDTDSHEHIDFDAYRPEGGGGSSSAPSGLASPPPPAAYGPRRLVRDPHARLGGVASGVGHYYGVDVTLVRLLFVAFVLATGFGLLLYFLAWLIIPRAEYWPPTPPKGGTRAGLDNRQVALGLLIVGVLIAAFATGGSGSQVLIALGLIGGGIWMFTQSPESVDNLQAAGVGEGSEAVAAASIQTDDNPVWYPTPQPVERRRRRIWPILLFPFLFVILPLIAVATLGLFLVAGGGDLEITSDGDSGELVVRAVTVDDLLTPIDQGVGSVTLDMSSLTAEDFADYDLPVEVEISNGLGEIDVIVPDDLEVSVKADVGAGEISVFGRRLDGLSPSFTSNEGDAVADLDLEVDLGSIEVTRADR